ncbi:zinc finger protein 503-like isoform X1 [Daphnia carinata]|uniref:zinc finger protein 503-like isoform X1 n=1 Tax=Daphnia carinata TaxID=120202 RepID=UPI00257EC924|nr:zinc finger protein 503-like isoform X1 [Daphnia carinata]
MLSSNGNPFLRAEYLNPPPATNTMDSKKSPLALLAQTCSQIGADPTPTTATKTTTTTTTCNASVVESRKKSASECSPHDKRDSVGSMVPTTEANNNNNGVQQQEQRPASSPTNAATTQLKATTAKKTSDVSANNNRLTPTDRRSKSTSPKNRSSVHSQPSAVDHPAAATASAAFVNPLLLVSPSQQQLAGGNHPSPHHHHQLMMAAALAHGSSDASASSAAAAAMSLANSYKSLMAASAGMAYGGHHHHQKQQHPQQQQHHQQQQQQHRHHHPSLSPYPHSAYSPHHASVAGASAGYGPPHPSALDFGAYANALNAAAVAKSTSAASSGNAFIPTSAATAAMMNGYLASQVHPAYSVAALQQAMHQQQHYGNAAAAAAAAAAPPPPPPPTRLPSSSSSSAAGLVQSKPTNSNADAACRDPYCTGCPASGVAASSSAAGQIHMVCTVGCALSVPCDHIKVPIAAHHLQMLSAPGASSPGSANGQPPPSSPHQNNNNSSSSSSSNNNRPYICNWIVADNYCGKRFASSDDLLQHLRTHTNLSSAGAATAPPSESLSTSSATGFAHPSSMMRAAYPTPPLSPLSAARYHPYGKANPSTTTTTTTMSATSLVAPPQPGAYPSASGLFHPGMAAAMAAMAAAGSAGPYGAVPPPPSAAAAAAAAAAAHLFHMNPALAPYYSHLSLFGHQTNNQASTRHVPGLGPAPLGGAGLGGQP